MPCIDVVGEKWTLQPYVHALQMYVTKLLDSRHMT